MYNPENCVVCVEGYIPSGTTDSGTYCVQLTQSSPNPDVTNCAVYGSMVPLTSSLTYGCIACNENFFYVGGYCVANISLGNYTCNIDNCVYCVQNNMCGQCAEGYTVFMGATNYCMKNYSPYLGCALTPINPFLTVGYQMCSKCLAGFALVGESCLQVNASISCQILGCNFCLTNNVCYECRQGFNQT